MDFLTLQDRAFSTLCALCNAFVKEHSTVHETPGLLVIFLRHFCLCMGIYAELCVINLISIPCPV